MSQSILGMDLADIGELLGSGQPGYRAKQLYQAIYRGGASDLVQITTFRRRSGRISPPATRSGFPPSPSATTRPTARDATCCRLDDGRTVETVLMPEGDRDTICISSQVGCPVDCKFCMTALLGLERSLTAGEIVGQVLLVAREHGLRTGAGENSRLNIVMMGQGEPLLNLTNVVKATRILLDPDGVGLSPKRVTVSTAGITPKSSSSAGSRSGRNSPFRSMRPPRRCGRNSCPSPVNTTSRSCWTPAGPTRCARGRSSPFEYVLLGGVNDTDADARRVVRLLANLNCKVNLIALNPGPEIPYRTPAPERVEAFQEIVRRSMPCFVRKPRGWTFTPPADS